MSKINELQKFSGYFQEHGFETDILEGVEKVKGKKKIESPFGAININIYYYNGMKFYEYNKDIDGYDQNLKEVVPALSMYASGPGLCSLGLQNIQLKTIKFPKKEDIEKLEDYLGCLLILLK